MFSKAVFASLVSLAVASPCPGTGKPTYPVASSSQGFNLVVNLVDPAKDFTPSIQNNKLVSIHIGPPFALIGLTEDSPNTRVFYQNGTAEEASEGKNTVISDSGTPPFPSGFSLLEINGTDVTTGRLDAGPGTTGVVISKSPEPYHFLEPETFLACNTSVPYYQGSYFITIKNTPDAENIPDECVPVRLIPQCAVLPPVEPQNDPVYSTHEFVLESPCYDDVASLNL